MVLLIAGGALNYVDRATLSVANKLIQDELGIPVAKMGLLLSAFLWAYAVAQLPVGGLIDRFGPRRVLGLGLFSWSVAQAAGGLVRNFGAFVVARVALGVGEAPLFPAGSRVVRDWFGIRERGFASGLCQSASSLGNFIAVPLLTFLMLRWSWRWMFVIVGAAGVVLAGVWWRIHRDPSEIRLTPDERRYLTEGGRTWFAVPGGYLPASALSVVARDPLAPMADGRPVAGPVAGKGMWATYDLLDRASPEAIVETMRANGLTHLYLQVGRSNLGFYGGPGLDRLLPLAHANGLAVVAWVYPFLKDTTADVNMTMSITGGTPLDLSGTYDLSGGSATAVTTQPSR